MQLAYSDPPRVLAFSLRLAAGHDREDGSDPLPDAGQYPVGQEDLPYKVELWNEGRTGVEVVLAVTANSSIGYAAYYAAAREYPERYVLLRHKNRTLAKTNSPDR